MNATDKVDGGVLCICIRQAANSSTKRNRYIEWRLRQTQNIGVMNSEPGDGLGRQLRLGRFLERNGHTNGEVQKRSGLELFFPASVVTFQPVSF